MTTLVRMTTRSGIVAAMILFSGIAGAQSHEQHHGQSASSSAASQAGQAAFAAVQEVVALLDTDPTSDWSKVRIDALREHLLDMDDLVMRATAKTMAVGDEIRFLVTGDGRTQSAIRRMVPAHAAMMNGYREWRFTTEEVPGGVLLSIAVAAPSERARIQALGFFGLLTLGSHHGPHHVAIAKGEATLKH